MSTRSAHIAGWGTYVPERVVTNDELGRRVDSSDEWIASRTGIRQRRFVGEGDTTSSLAVRAAEQAVDRAGVRLEDIQLVISASDTPDYFFPPTAELIQRSLGIGCGGFDVQAGCSGFVYGLAMGSQMIATGAMDIVLVTGAEALSRFLNFEDRSTCVIFGDGAGAAVLRPCSRERGLQAFELGSDGSGAQLISCPAGGSARPASLETVASREHFVHMAGNDVFKFATLTLGGCAERLAAKAGWKLDDIDLFIPHQANIRIIEAARRRLDLPAERVFVNLDRYGNTSCASIPLAMAEAVAAGRLKPGHKVVMVAFGVGLTWAGAAMTWG